MVAAQGGDAEAYQSLLEGLLPYLRATVRSKLGEDPALEDVVQEVLIRVHTARHTYHANRPLLPWIRTIARNASIDALRKRARRQGREEELEAESMPAAPAPASSLLSKAMVQALDHLPAAQREAVVLLKLEGLTIQEAARKAGVTPGAIKLRAHRGYRALRQQLEGERS